MKLQLGPKSSAFPKLALGGSLLINLTLLSYYASLRSHDGRAADASSLLQAGLDGIADANASGQLAASGPPSPASKHDYFSAGLKAEVDSSLLQGLSQANRLQEDRLIKREQALLAQDPTLGKPTTSAGNIRLSTQQPAHQLYQPHAEWGFVNPDSGMQRLTCADSIADASGNGAPKGRFWGQGGGAQVKEADGECAGKACNVGEVCVATFCNLQAC